MHKVWRGIGPADVDILTGLKVANSCNAHFTGEPGVFRPWNIDRADQIGVFLETALHALEPGLCLAIVARHMTTARTCPACVLQWHCHQPAALPCRLQQVLPAVDPDMFRTCKSSIHTIAWFWLIVVLVLCRKSRRVLPIFWCSVVTLAFFQLLLNFVLRLMACCGRRPSYPCPL